MESNKIIQNDFIKYVHYHLGKTSAQIIEWYSIWLLLNEISNYNYLFYDATLQRKLHSHYELQQSRYSRDHVRVFVTMHKFNNFLCITKPTEHTTLQNDAVTARE